MSRMNALIAMQGQSPDFIGSLARGQQAKAQQEEYTNQNALRAAYQEHGAGAIAGDRNALAGIAAYDPMGAQRMQLGQSEDARRGVESQHGMKIDDQRVAIAQQEAAMRAQEFAMQADDRTLAKEREEIGRLAAMAQTAYAQGPEAWDRYNDTLEGYENVPYDTAPMVIAGFTGTVQGLEAAAPIKARPGDVFLDPKTYKPISSVPEQQAFRDASPEEEARYGVPGQVGPDGRFHPINKPSGMSISSTPDGGLRFAQGPGVTASGGGFTEGQSKDNVYSTRARGALPVVNKFGTALTSRVERAAELDPTGFAREYQSDDFQMAKQAGDEFLTAILRKDTGAAITPQEETVYGRVYLPRPGDNEAVLTQKEQARERAVAAIESGMSPAQMLAQENALKASGPAPAGGPSVGEVVEGHVFNGGDPADPASWTKQ